MRNKHIVTLTQTKTVINSNEKFTKKEALKLKFGRPKITIETELNIYGGPKRKK